MVPELELQLYLAKCRERLETCDGNGFQEFFQNVMFQKHGDRFQSPAPHGKFGDMGCDGYLNDGHHAFQCYSPDTLTPAKAQAKLSLDFGKAHSQWPSMKKWCYVINENDVPAPIVNAVTKVKVEGVELTTWSRKNIYDILRTLTRPKLQALLGSIDPLSAMEKLTREAIAAVIERVSLPLDARDAIVMPPPSKMQTNKIGTSWQGNLRIGMAGSTQVKKHFETVVDPDLGGRVAGAVRAEYEALQKTGADADRILNGMANFFQQASAATPGEYLAVYAVITYFFETCHILEPGPTTVIA